MHRPIPFLAAVAISSALPAGAAAQSASPDHAHGQPPAAGQPATAADQHGQQAGAPAADPAPGEHPADCNCCCCQMMRRMMMEMHGAHGQSAPAATPDEHQRHQAQTPH
jgi:hypothetical protein